jgi:hypothetical protein
LESPVSPLISLWTPAGFSKRPWGVSGIANGKMTFVVVYWIMKQD